MYANSEPFEIVSIHRRPAVRRPSTLRMVWYIADGRPRARWIVIGASFAERRRRRAR